MAISKQRFQSCATAIGCNVEAVMAVAAVESRGGGFDPENFPKTLFEALWFHKFTKGKYTQSNPTISSATWNRALYGKSWQEEKARLNQAIALDRTSALMSASWGMFQIMGFNYPKCGYKTVQQFVTAMCKSEDEQLTAFTQYIINSGLADELQDHRWTDFARLYNGVDFAKNAYDVKLQAAYNKALLG
jgi:N-acetylmuramidase